MRFLLHRIAVNRRNYWHEAASLAQSVLPRWSPQVERCRDKYYLWQSRVERTRTR